MTNTRIELLNELCEKIGLKRAKPKSQYLSRRELEYIRGWMDAMINKDKNNDDK